MRIFFSERVELLRPLNEDILFRSGLSYSDHSLRVFFPDRVELLNEGIFSERVELLRLLNEGIFFGAV